MYQSRFYRKWLNKKFNNYQISYLETDLLIRTIHFDEKRYYGFIVNLRKKFDSYIKENPNFLYSLSPIKIRPEDPPEIKEILEYSNRAEVGPMAAIAGFFAEKVGRVLLAENKEVIVENGGDIFLSLEENPVLGIYAGVESPFTGRVGIKIKSRNQPLGICTSAGTVGPSLSLGKADAVITISPSCILADAVATATANLVKTKEDIEKALDFAWKIKQITGIVIIKGDRLGTRGEIELVKTRIKDGDKGGY